MISTPSVGPDLAALLSLQRADDTTLMSRVHQTNRNGVVYGGQILAQALAAAMDGMCDRPPLMLQLCFLAPAQAGQPLHYRIDSARDGNSLSTRRVVGTQGGREFAAASVALAQPGRGFAHERPWTPNPPAPEALDTLATLEQRHGPQVSAHGKGRLRCYPQVDVRPVRAPQHLLIEAGPPRCQYWIRALLPADASSVQRHAALAYMSDYLLINPALIPHADRMPERRLFVASLDHSLWFHADPWPGDWLLYDTHSPWSGDGRALCQGHFYDLGGRLIASCAQSALVRPLQ